jgi:Ca2+-binding RTX toxin-like protein
MTVFLNQADLAFLLAAVDPATGGSNPPAGTDPFSLAGLRTIDGTNNNLTHTVITDQHGNTVDTDTFANVDQPFFHIEPNTPNVYTGTYTPGVGGSLSDTSPRIISNLIADQTATNPSLSVDATGNPGAPAFFIPPSSALFTFFGQFFDHGLDFINKGGNGTVTIPLLPNDPLFGAAAPAPSAMFMTRATLDGNGDTTNSTAPLVEQSQTYGQRETTTFYLKEYKADMSGELTGRLVTHADGTMATWADIKANALLAPDGLGGIGITLLDEHVLDIPDPASWTGAGFAAGAGTGQSFLADIAHNANPGGLAAGNPDADGDVGNAQMTNMFGQNTTYDNELLDRHKIAGDPRANENVVLTSIHQAFHAEHNRLVLKIQDLIDQQEIETPGFAFNWDGERIFEAAKLINEMQYQHFVFEEFGRRLSPNIDAFAGYDVTINPNISAEFSQAVYRLGHSMLTDKVISVNDVDQTVNASLIDSFLNPIGFDNVGAASLIEGQNRQQMNLIDEHVVDAVRNFLVGLPLDLVAINIARGRDVGLGTLNQTRAELFDQTGESTLTPYANWAEFGANLLHPDSLVNFIAAYASGLQLDGGVDATGAAIAAARNAGTTTAYADARALAAAAMLDTTFMGTAGVAGDKNAGFNDIDLWIGGLAESKVIGPGGVPGMLGSTFDFVFAMQMRALQDGDRLYYLARLGGTNILDEIEAATIGDLFERGTGARHTMGDIFSTPDQNVEISAEPGNDFTSVMGDWHEVIGGNTQDNIINAGAGNDTVWGEAGNDTISGGGGNDHLYGQAGNDTISGGSGDDFIRGNAGDDIITGDGGADIIFGGTGNDTVSAGTGADEVFGQRGDDVIRGGDQDDALFGNENDDMLFGDAGDDALDGGDGDDFLDGGLGADTLNGGPGNDVLVGSPGGDVLNGGIGGYDLAWYQESAPGSIEGIVIDMTGAVSTGNALGDVFLDIEEVRGTPFDDGIIGDDFANVLSGGAGADVIEGGLGNDVLYGGPGNNTLRGDGGVDQAVFFGTHIASVTGGVVATPGDLGGAAAAVFEINIDGDIQSFDITDGPLDTLAGLAAAINTAFGADVASIVGGNQLQLTASPAHSVPITITETNAGAAALAGLTLGAFTPDFTVAVDGNGDGTVTGLGFVTSLNSI